MTDQNGSDTFDVREPFAVVEAFADGERVDRDALNAALADPAGREYLLDLLALRDAVGGMAPSRWSAGNRAVAPRFRWVAAAALVVCGIGGGYFAGTRTIEARSASPNVAVVITLPEAEITPAPPPTKVIRLRPGVDWTDTKGEK
jgi:hypothetical protein